MTLLRTADLVKRFVTDVVTPVGITHQQYNVLRILRGAGEEGLPTLDIGERMVERSPGVTRLVDRLVAKGLVTRERCPDDRRQVICRISESGLDLLARLDEPVDDATSRALAGLDESEIDRLVQLLDRVRAAQAS
ncbi:MAG: MarR family winged helix-turn-helix transcriptional regulator [Gemmatimonadota bacterium]